MKYVLNDHIVLSREPAGPRRDPSGLGRGRPARGQLVATRDSPRHWARSSSLRAEPHRSPHGRGAGRSRHPAPARLGLRAGEVAFLELDDIDWAGGCLSVRGKGGRRSQLPLPQEVGEALAAYLQEGRLRSPSRRVFLRAKAPIRGFLGQSAVGTVVRHALRRAGVDAPTHGAHQFRHGLATEMLRHGAVMTRIIPSMVGRERSCRTIPTYRE
jgi:integrase